MSANFKNLSYLSKWREDYSFASSTNLEVWTISKCPIRAHLWRMNKMIQMIPCSPHLYQVLSILGP